MKITKFGHCCLLVEENSLRLLTDPGAFSDGQNEVIGIDVVLITHEHQDHFHLDSVKKIIQNNPEVKILTNKTVGDLLNKEAILFSLVEDGQSLMEKGVLIEGFGKEHAIIHSSIPVVQNTGYMIGNKLFYPGDAFIKPGKPVEVLALPTAGPWMKVSEAIDYALAVQPKISFAVHDAVLAHPEMLNGIPQRILAQLGVRLDMLDLKRTYEF